LAERRSEHEREDDHDNIAQEPHPAFRHGISLQRWRAGANASIAGIPPWPCDRFRLTDFNAARCERPARRQKVTCTAQDTTQRSALSRLDARGFEDRAPLGDLCTDERIELRGAIADQLEPLRAEPRLHGRVLRD